MLVVDFVIQKEVCCGVLKRQCINLSVLIAKLLQFLITLKTLRVFFHIHLNIIKKSKGLILSKNFSNEYPYDTNKVDTILFEIILVKKYKILIHFFRK